MVYEKSFVKIKLIWIRAINLDVGLASSGNENGPDRRWRK